MFEAGLDIALIVVMAYFMLRGVFRGVVKEVVAFLGLFVAFWAAGVYWPLGAEHFKAIFDVPGQRGVSSFMIIFLTVYFFITLIAFFVDKIIKLTLSPVTSALMGLCVGVVKGALMCGIILIAAETFVKPSANFFAASVLWPYAKPVTSQARAWLPEALRNSLTGPAASLAGRLTTAPPAAAPPAANAGGGPAPRNPGWQDIQNLLATRPEAIAPAWRDKLRSVAGAETLTNEDIKRFISDHPGLFAGGPADSAPSWPQPAAE
ncbi:MAG: CvpA family protein [Candidatus Adiutrix sp.]|jgi:membrane protein required for colicin V production|nr:CvpA family protein [Candidatus Adiutrix sp.]